MRYPAPEKLEIIRLVEQSHLPVRRTLAQIGVPPATFYRWYDLYQTGGPEALEDCSPRPGRVWNRIPDQVREQIVQLALDEPELSPRELNCDPTIHHSTLRIPFIDPDHVTTLRVEANRIPMGFSVWTPSRQPRSGLPNCRQGGSDYSADPKNRKNLAVPLLPS